MFINKYNIVNQEKIKKSCHGVNTNKNFNITYKLEYRYTVF